MKIIEAQGARIPAIGFGTYTLQGPACVDMVANAIQAGYRHIDTARMYGNEREVGEGIRRSGIPRSEIFVTSKIWWTDIGAGDLLSAARATTETIDLGALDLLLVHWPNLEIPLEDTMEGMNEAARAGLAHNIGVANFSSSMLDEACAISERAIVCNQVEYHPMLSQENVLAACRRHDMAMIAYCPIGRGGDVLNNSIIRAAAERHSKTPAQIVLRWEVEQDQVGAIPRTGRPERLSENIDIFDFELSEEERTAINSLTRRRERLVDPSFAPVWDRA